MTNHHDTITAPATAAGGAIAVVRISGPEAIGICDRIFRATHPLAQAAPNTIHYGHIVDGERIIDEVLVSVFHAPHSYTGDHSIEISCHGSRYITAEILRLLLHAGARMALPGEFTTRAFLAGKLDLAQAEAVADLIASSSRAAHTIATSQMRGTFSNKLHTLRTQLVQLTSLLELELDFSEEDVEFADRTALRQTMCEISTEIESLRQSFSLGNVIKEGVPVAIVGAPNVGKSTLLNCLVGEERAMVSDIAGTTRDSIEETIDLEGIRFRFIDTAGIRTTDDQLERMGIERTITAAERAKIIIRIATAAMPEQRPELAIHPGQQLIEVVNKVDLTPEYTLPPQTIGISARRNVGIDTLRQALCNSVDTTALDQNSAVVSSTRHYEALTSACEALCRALLALDSHTPTDLLCEDIRDTLHHLGSITGEVTTDEILGTIFSKFCIGK